MTSNQTTQKPKVGIFIDGSNLLWAMKLRADDGQRINFEVSFERLRGLLEDQYSPVFCNYYCCEDNAATKEPYLLRADKQKRFHRILEEIGYCIVRKDLKHIRNVTKCDTDVEVVVDMYQRESELDTIVLFSGDSDFRAALEHFHAQGKNIHIYAFRRCLSWELKEFAITKSRCHYWLLDDLKEKIKRISIND